MKRGLIVLVSATAALLCAASTALAAPALSQSSVTVGIGQSTVITAQNPVTQIYRLSNSNPDIADLLINESQITITGRQSGSTAMSICYVTSSSDCAALSVTVTTGQTTNTTNNSGGLSFNPQNPTIMPGQTLPVTISGGSGYFVSSNSNPDMVPASINGNQVSVSGNQVGASTITICSSTNVCSALKVTVSTSAGSTTGVTFSPTNPTLAVGQTLSVSIGGQSSTYFISLNSAPSLVQATINANNVNTLVLYGLGTGSASITVCGNSGGCTTLPITITGTAATTPIAPTPTPVTTPPVNTGVSLLSVIQAMQVQLAQLLAQVQTMATALNQLAASTGATVSPSTNAGSATITKFTFTQLLDINSEGAEVTALQKRLTELGLYSGPITGRFGALTQAAVKKFQTLHGIDAKGFVGPETRATLNAQ